MSTQLPNAQPITVINQSTLEGYYNNLTLFQNNLVYAFSSPKYGMLYMIGGIANSNYQGNENYGTTLVNSDNVVNGCWYLDPSPTFNLTLNIGYYTHIQFYLNSGTQAGGNVEGASFDIVLSTDSGTMTYIYKLGGSSEELLDFYIYNSNGQLTIYVNGNTYTLPINANKLTIKFYWYYLYGSCLGGATIPGCDSPITIMGLTDFESYNPTTQQISTNLISTILTLVVPLALLGIIGYIAKSYKKKKPETITGKVVIYPETKK